MFYDEMANNLPVNDGRTSTEGRLRSNSYDQAISYEERKMNDSTLVLTRDKNPSPIKQTNNDDIYLIKWIEFNNDRVPILLQNQNGPCPLLAIANILFLRARIRLNSGVGEISTEKLTTMIVNYMLQIDTSKLSNEERANLEHNIQDAFAVLPKLSTGIDVNLKFNGVDKFEYTPECIVFDLLNIQLFHGWVIDPQNDELRRIIDSNGSSYNQLVEKMIQQKHSQNATLARESLIIEQFLEESRSQLTHYGLLKLTETMRPNQLAVFFRNNHFSTIWKNNNQLLLLVSDQGFINHPSIVFETLTDIDNNSTFTDGYGQKWKKAEDVNTLQDRALAMAMQDEEKHLYHEEQLRQQYPEEHYNSNSRKSQRKHRHRRNAEDDSDCGCILS